MRFPPGYPFVVSAVVLGSAAAPALATWPTDPTVNLPIATCPITRFAPQIITDGAGGAMIVWEEIRLVEPDSVFGDIFAQRVGQGGDLLWAIDGVGVGLTTTDWEGPRAPQIVSGGDYGGIVAWEDHRGADWDIYAQRIGPFGEKLWDAEGVAICSAAADEGQIRMTSDGEGGAIISWVDYRGGYYSDLYAQKVDKNGNVLWTLDGVPVCLASRDQTEQRLVPDGAHGAILVWEDERNWTTMAEDVFAQRVDAGGTPRWTPNGIPICVEIDRQLGADITADHAGGAVIAWQDLRGLGEPGDIYAQRVDEDGNVLWTPNGIAVCNAPSTQREPAILADGDSATYLCWSDLRDGNEPDLYAQRVDPKGNALWTPGGVPVSRAPNWQYRLQMVPDLSGGVILTWEDTRNYEMNYSDVYAQRVDSTGTLSTPTGIKDQRETPTSAMYPPVPNPGSGRVEFRFSLSAASEVTIEIYDVAGRRVRMERIGQMDGGEQRYFFDGKDRAGHLMPSGVYFVRVSAGNLVRTQKFVVSR